MGQKNVCILHHQCEKIKFLGRKMNFIVATPEHVTLQIQRQVTDLNHAENPRCAHARSLWEGPFEPGDPNGPALTNRTYQSNAVDLTTDGKKICAMIGPDPVQGI